MNLGDRKFRTRKQQAAFERSLPGIYQKLLRQNPFLYFGLPFCSVIVLGSFWLSNFTAVKYEHADSRQQEITEDQLLNIKKNQRPFDMKEEYYRLQGITDQEWEPVRVPRFEGESENVFDSQK